jgi:steroid delta-isomerase-like uncharacterized protein
MVPSKDFETLIKLFEVSQKLPTSGLKVLLVFPENIFYVNDNVRAYMKPPAYKNFLLQYYEEVYNKGKIEALEKYVSSDIIDHSAPGGPAKGIDHLKGFLGSMRSAFPDYSVELEDIVCEDEKVAVRLSERGTHKGKLWGIPPTGKKVSVTVYAIYKFANEKISEVWALSNQTGLMRQLGLTSD